MSVYGAPGESVSRYLHRGSRVAIDGRLEWREWETAAQERRQAVSIVADTVQFLDGPGQRGQLDDEDEGHSGDGEGIASSSALAPAWTRTTSSSEPQVAEPDSTGRAPPAIDGRVGTADAMHLRHATAGLP